VGHRNPEVISFPIEIIERFREADAKELETARV
jgi:hypothetical protein